VFVYQIYHYHSAVFYIGRVVIARSGWLPDRYESLGHVIRSWGSIQATRLNLLTFPSLLVI